MYAPLTGLNRGFSKYFPALWYCLFWPLAVILCGVPMHYLFVFSGCNSVVGLFAPVNESVFEHTKMMTFPLALAWLIDGFVCLLLYEKKIYFLRNEVWFHVIACTAAVYVSVVFMLVFFYLVVTVIGFHNLEFTIILFCVSILVAQGVGFLLLRRMHSARWIVSFGALLFLVAMIACQMAFTDSTPHQQWLFMDEGGFYGRPDECGHHTHSSNVTTSVQSTSITPQSTPAFTH
jgi:hypothetical protein